MDGILIINKPAGLTSFDVVARVRRLTREKKCGHTGTLDPMATGVLPVLLGSATKLAPFLVDSNKEYLAGMELGRTTDTLDITGQVTKEVPLTESAPLREAVEQAMAGFLGDILQVPPMYSALKKDGQRMYDLARQGITLELQARPVTIYELELLSYRFPCLSFRAVTSKGTYIRSLVRDLGESLGYPAVMTSLERTLTGGFSIKEAITLEELETLDRMGIIGKMIQAERPLERYPELLLNERLIRLLLSGVRLRDPEAVAALESGLYRLKNTKRELIGLTEFADGELIVKWRA